MTRQEYLEHYLEELDLTNVDLARFAGVAPSSVQRWVSGTIPPPLMLIRMLECMSVLKRIGDLSDDARRLEWMRESDQPETVNA